MRFTALLPLSLVAACASEVEAPTGGLVIEGVDYPPVVSLSCPDTQVQVNVPARIVATASDVEKKGAVTTLMYLAADEAPVADELAVEHAWVVPGLQTVVFTAKDVGGNESRAACTVDVVGDAPAVEEPVVDEPVTDGEVPPPAVDDGAAPVVDEDGTDAPVTDEPVGIGRMNATAYQYVWPLSVPADVVSGEQAAEHAVNDFGSWLYEVGSAVTDTGFLANDLGTRGPSSLPGLSTVDPGIVDSFGVKYTGTLTPPAGAATVVLSATGDDVVVVRLNGNIVASADGEYAFDAERTVRAPAQTTAIPVAGAMSLVLYVVDQAGPFAWDVGISFSDAAGNALGAGTITAD